MDALALNLEAYCASGYHPMADGIALEGMNLIKKWLLIAVNEGKNLEARSAMLVAATMGSTAFQKGLGAIHSLSHPVNSVYNIHHGNYANWLIIYIYDGDMSITSSNHFIQCKSNWVLPM